jgi:hypothetical protein
VATIAGGAVTYAKMQNVAAARLLGNPTGSAAAPGEITLGTNLTFAGSVLNAASGGSGTINGVTAGAGLAGGGTTGTVTLSTSVPPVTKTANYTVAAADLGGTLVLGGVTATLTLPAGIFTPGSRLGLSVTASGSWSVTNATGLTYAGFNSTSLPAGTSGTFIANNDGTTLNFVPGMQTPTATVLGGARSLGATANQFVTGLNVSGVLTAAQPAFSNLSGTATYAQLQNVAASRVLGNPGGSAAAPSEISLGTLLSFSGTTLNVAQTYVSAALASGSALALTTGVTRDITSISLVAGDWDVEGSIWVTLGGTTSLIAGWVHNVSVTEPALGVAGQFYCNFPQTFLAAAPTGMKRFNLGSTTTIYLSVVAAFTSTASAYGEIRARRVG